MKSNNLKYLLIGILFGLTIFLLLGVDTNKAERYQVTTSCYHVSGTYYIISVYDSQNDTVKIKEFRLKRDNPPIDLKAEGLIK